MEEGYSSLPSSHLRGSVPAVIPEEKKPSTSESAAPNANLQIFPPNNGGYQSPKTPYDGDEQTTSNWKGFFSISSYQPYFNVDSDIVVDRLISSVYPTNDFHRKIEVNPDMYGPVWITTTLVFIFAALGNCATYLIHQRYEQDVIWNFDVTYVNWAASIVYGYALLVPAAFYFLLQYLGTNASLIRLWCMWGYSLFVFIPSSDLHGGMENLQWFANDIFWGLVEMYKAFLEESIQEKCYSFKQLLLVIPVEFIRWIIIILAGTASSWFIYENLKVYAEESHDLMVLVASALVLQFALAIFIKVFFFV